jgi:hypothetical protein
VSRDRRARLVAKELQLTLSSETRTLYFHGESMRPFLVEGDRVVVKPVVWDDIRVGDLITYRVQDKFPTRRVVGRSRQGLHLWCENWPERRFWAARADVLGRAVARKRGELWTTSEHAEWRVARRTALRAYWRRYGLALTIDGARRAVAKAARLFDLGRCRSARLSREP